MRLYIGLLASIFMMVSGCRDDLHDDLSWEYVADQVNSGSLEKMVVSSEDSLVLGPGSILVKKPENFGLTKIPDGSRILSLKVLREKEINLGVYLITSNGAYIILVEGGKIPDFLSKSYSISATNNQRVFKVNARGGPSR